MLNMLEDTKYNNDGCYVQEGPDKGNLERIQTIIEEASREEQRCDS